MNALPTHPPEIDRFTHHLGIPSLVPLPRYAKSLVTAVRSSANNDYLTYPSAYGFLMPMQRSQAFWSPPHQEYTMPEPSPDPLITPWIAQFAAHLKSGKITPERLSGPWMDKWSWFPPALLPFVESPNMSTLADVLKAHPMLYWHPLVFRQLRYLLRLRRDEAEWARLGWEWQSDEDGLDRPPKEVASVQNQFEKLVEAHVSGLFPGRRMVWKPKHQKRGPKSRLKNPHPTGEPWTNWVEASELYDDFRELHALFKGKLKQARRPTGPTKAAAKEWYRQLAEEVLAASSIWWSDLKDYEVVEDTVTDPPANYTCHPLPSAPPHPQADDLWIDTSVTPYVLKKYDTASATWHTSMTINAKDVSEALAIVDAYEQPIREHLIERWKPLDLNAPLDKILARNLGRTGQPAYLAYAVLGALLGVTPEKIKDRLDNYRHPRRRRRKH